MRTAISENVEMLASAPQALLNLHACSHGYIHPHRRSLSSQQWTHHVQNHTSTLARSHSWAIVCLWRPTISCFSHVRQLIPLSPRLLDSALVVWIWRRAGTGGTMPCSCPRLRINFGHGLKILPTATPWDNKALSAGGAAQTLPWQRTLVYSCVHLSWEC